MHVAVVCEGVWVVVLTKHPNKIHEGEKRVWYSMGVRVSLERHVNPRNPPRQGSPSTAEKKYNGVYVTVL